MGVVVAPELLFMALVALLIFAITLIFFIATVALRPLPRLMNVPTATAMRDARQVRTGSHRDGHERSHRGR